MNFRKLSAIGLCLTLVQGQLSFAAQPGKSHFWRNTLIVGGAIYVANSIYRAGEQRQLERDQRQLNEAFARAQRERRGYNSLNDFSKEQTSLQNQELANQILYQGYLENWARVKVADVKAINEMQSELAANTLATLDGQGAKWICQSLCGKEIDISSQYSSFADQGYPTIKLDATPLTSQGATITEAFVNLGKSCEAKGEDYFLLSGAITSKTADNGMRIGYLSAISGQACFSGKTLNLSEISEAAGTQPNPANPQLHLRSKVLDVRVLAEPGEEISNTFMRQTALEASVYNMTDTQQMLENELKQNSLEEVKARYKVVIDKQTQEYVIFDPKDKSLERKIARLRVAADAKSNKAKYYLTSEVGFRIQHSCGEEAHRIAITVVLEDQAAPKNTERISDRWKALYTSLNRSVVDNYCQTLKPE